jgi:hypothetical protein
MLAFLLLVGGTAAYSVACRLGDNCDVSIFFDRT